MRIALVNDMVMAVEAVRRVLVQVPEYQIAWIARDGAEAVSRCAEDTPDIVLMDLLMPVMDGVEATRRIMQRSPCAVLVVTSTVEGNASKVFEAMGHGALDAVGTPVLGASGQVQGGAALLEKIATIGQLLGIRVVGKRAAPAAEHHPTLMLLGSSTGGPKALETLLAGLPAVRPWSVLIAQHIDVQFASGLADWLTTQTGHQVRLATSGGIPEAGAILLAATNDHLVLTPDLKLAYTPEPNACPYRPSVDALFESAARHWPNKGVAALLTGMGRDGAAGLLTLKKAGWHTIAQDQETSVLYGMPKAAAELGAANKILPLPQIAAALTSAITP